MLATALLAALALVAGTGLAASAQAAPSAGETIYRLGKLSDGAPLRGAREAGVTAEGAQAACVSCHQHSGLGMREGKVSVPPITGQYLFHPRISGEEGGSDLPFVESMHGNRDPYTDESLAKAIRAGVDPGGRPLSYLMPRYALDEAAMRELITYLKSMTRQRQPGVGDNELVFATVATPDADPVKRELVLQVVRQYFGDKNRVTRFETPRVRSARPMMFRVQRHWRLVEWQLKGPAAGWEEQLRALQKRDPVLAVISGIGGQDFAPVRGFCEHDRVPCLFPNVEWPVAETGDFYTIYLNDGVRLEARLLAKALADKPPQRVVQVFRAGDVGERAARELSRRLPESVAREPRRLPAAGGAAELRSIIAGARRGDALVLWLRAADLGKLGAPPAEATPYFSSILAGLDGASLAPEWRSVAHMAYTVDLPMRRQVRMDYQLGWFRLRQVPVSDLRLQSDTLLSCGLVAETLGHMVDTFVPEYLVERLSSQIDHRILTAMYPHLTLGIGQSFASKGGYVVHFTGPGPRGVVPDTDWIVP